MALTPVIDPNAGADQPTQTLQPRQIVRSNAGGPTPTEAQIKQLRDIASQLMSERSNSANAYGKLGGIGLGLENATGKISGALDYRNANKLDRDLSVAEAAENAKAYRNQPSPNASGAPPMTPAGAAGGSPAAAPFPQSQSPQPGQQVASLGPTPQSPQEQGEQSPPTTSTPTQGQGSPKLDLGGGVSEKAMRTSARGETGKSSLMGALFNISPDTGGSLSYGPFGLNSKSGSLNSFIKEHPELGFKGANPGEWRRIAATNKEGMVDALKDWHGKHIMGGLGKDLTDRGTPDEIANDPKVQHYMADRKVQMGKVGLDAAVRYANVNSRTPEDWIARVSQADKQRIPYNFASYLRDNPNNARGLVNRIDQRHGEALAGADPATTAAMVDDLRNNNRAGRTVLAGPPTGGDGGSGDGASAPGAGNVRVAQNTQAPQGSFQQQLGDYITGMGAHGGHRLSQDEIRTFIENKNAVNPKYGVDEYGRITKTAPGEIPYIYGQQPGAPGKVTTGIGGIPVQEHVDQNGNIIQTPIIPKFNAPSGSGTGKGAPAPNTAPPPAPPTRPTATAAPTPTAPATTVQPPRAGQGDIVQAPNQPPATASASAAPAAAGTGGPLTTNPPTKPGALPAGTQPGSQLALANINPFESVAHSLNEGPTKIAQALGPDAPKMPVYNIEKPTSDEENGVRQNLDWAYSNPPAPLNPRNALTEASKILNDPNASDTEKMDALINMKAVQDSSKAALEDKMKTQDKGFAELQKSIRDTEKQSNHLAPELKGAIQILNSPDFESGPASGLVTATRALREEAAAAFRRMGAAAKARGDDPTTYDNMANWIFDEKNSPSATANQVYTKILSGSILQSLRGMLGPNAGQFRVQELKMLEQAFGNPDLTINANKTVMNMIDKMNDRNILIGKMANEYARKKGGLDASFEDALSNFETNYPVFTPQDVVKLGKITLTGKTDEDAANPPPPPPPANPGPSTSPGGGPPTGPPPLKLRPGFQLSPGK